MKQIISADFKLGIIAGGQLAKMLVLKAATWDVKSYILDPSPECPCAKICDSYTQGDITNFDDVYNFGKDLDMITLEIENVNVDALAKLKSEGVAVYPDPEILRTIQDKGLQKQFYAKHNIATSAFKLYEDEKAIKAAMDAGELKPPFVQKTRTAGYDGRGVLYVKDANVELLQGPSLVEEAVDIEKELAVIVCRNTKGEISSFPPVEMEFNPDANLVEFLLCPANISEAIAAKATELAIDVAQAFDMEGILAVELFLDKQGNILVNEVAPRPHNSGHHTIESIFTSQYEQHLRAVLGFPLGSTDIKIPSVMMNILGDDGFTGNVVYEGVEECMALDGVNIHIYGKKQTRPFRKMGHITILDKDLASAKAKAAQIKQHLKVKA